MKKSYHKLEISFLMNVSIMNVSISNYKKLFVVTCDSSKDIIESFFFRTGRMSEEDWENLSTITIYRDYYPIVDALVNIENPIERIRILSDPLDRIRKFRDPKWTMYCEHCVECCFHVIQLINEKISKIEFQDKLLKYYQREMLNNLDEAYKTLMEGKHEGETYSNSSFMA